MRVVVAHRAVELGHHCDIGDARAGADQARRDVGHLLAQRGRRRRLAVGARQQRQFGQIVRKGAKTFDDAIEPRQENLRPRIIEHQRVRGVVDVFRGATEVDELGDAHHLGIVLETFLEPVFDSLDVVVRRRLDLLHLVGIRYGETGNHQVEFGDGVAGERRHFGDLGRGGQRLEPFDLDADTVADQAEFGKMGAQRLDLGGIATVERGKRRQGAEVG